MLLPSLPASARQDQQAGVQAKGAAGGEEEYPVFLTLARVGGLEGGGGERGAGRGCGKRRDGTRVKCVDLATV